MKHSFVCSLLFISFVVINGAPCVSTGDTSPDCTCVSTAQFNCSGTETDYECQYFENLQCKYFFEGKYYCQASEKWVNGPDEKPRHPDKYLTTVNGKTLSTTGNYGLSQCPFVQCNSPGGFNNSDCFCRCQAPMNGCPAITISAANTFRPRTTE